jgi:glucose dehydrogenase
MNAKLANLAKALTAVALVLILLAAAACTSSPSATPTATLTTTPGNSTPPVTTSLGNVPPEIAQAAKDWPLPGRDYANTRATTDSSINSGNINSLGVAWAFPIPGASIFGNAATTPIVMGNSLYFQDLKDNIFALNRSTGALLWQKIYNVPNIGPNGLAVGYGKVFASADPYNFVALDMNNGNELWRTLISKSANIGTDTTPTVYNGKVFTSTVPGVGASNYYIGGAIGTFYALDQQTGKISWSWDTVDTPDLWGNKAINSGGGAWYAPAIDTKTGLSFWGVGNPAPFPGTTDFPNGSSRPGNNLYTSSMTAIDSSTGKLQWYNQVVPHDIKDWDFQIPPVLASANLNGQATDIVVGAGKMGKVVAFNRQTGAQIWNVKVGSHQNDDLTQFPAGQTTAVFPGIYGGVETPMSYSDGIVFVPVVNLETDFTPTSLKTIPFAQATGDFLALDVSTGKTLWEKQLPSPDFGGATVVNDMVITATYDGTIMAFKKQTGDLVWTYKAQGGINAWPAVAGDTIYYPIGLGAVPSLLALKLGANSPIVNMSPASGATLSAGDVKVSAQIFNFKIVDKLGQAAAAGEGHIHYFMDADAPTTQGKPAVTSPGTYAAVIDTSYTWKNVAPGTHTFSVELVNNDHTPLNPPVVSKATVNVVTPTPAISIIYPPNNSAVPTGGVGISVQVSNFNVVDKLGQPASPGEGHIHYFMDVDAPTAPGQPAVTGPGTYAAVSTTYYTWSSVPIGTHTFSVELVNNDHTPLTPPVVAKITLTVTSTGQGGP